MSRRPEPPRLDREHVTDVIRVALVVLVVASAAAAATTALRAAAPQGSIAGGALDDWAVLAPTCTAPSAPSRSADAGCDADRNASSAARCWQRLQPRDRGSPSLRASAELQCYPAAEGTRVDLAPGECASELNTLYLCVEGGCDAFDDAPCSPLTCGDDTILRFCDAGACSSSAASACDAARACTAEDFTDVCPTIACDGAAQQGCLPSGFCQISCV